MTFVVQSYCSRKKCENVDMLHVSKNSKKRPHRFVDFLVKLLKSVIALMVNKDK